MAFSLLPTSFEDIKTYLIQKIQQKYPTLGAFLQNTFLILIVDLFAYAIALFMNYAADLFSESKLSTATNKENIRLQAAFYGYIAKRKTSATGTIKIGMNSTFTGLPTSSIVFQKHDAIQINGIKYLFKESVTFSSNPLDMAYEGLPTGTYYIIADVVQGQIVTASKVAKGEQSETFEVINSNIEQNFLSVFVNSVEYTQVDTFINSTATDLHYMVDNLKGMSGIKITFGDGFRANQLDVGDVVDVNFRETLALEGQIKSVGFLVNFLVTYTYPDTTPVTFYGVNDTRLVGAEDVDTLDDIKYFGKLSASSIEGKAFDDGEVQLAIENFGGILKSKALSEFDVSPEAPRFDFLNRVKLLVVPTGGGSLDDVKKQDLRTYLRDQMDFTDFIEFVDVEYIGIRFKFLFDVINTTPSDFSAQVDAYLATEYALGKLDFGQSVDHSEVVYKVTNQFRSYIKRFELTLQVIEEYTNVNIPTGDIVTRTLKIGSLRDSDANVFNTKFTIFYKKGTGATYSETYADNGAGAYVKEGAGAPDAIIASSINYITGVVSFTVAGTVTDIPQIEYLYETYDTDGAKENVDIKSMQIVEYDSSQISIEFV